MARTARWSDRSQWLRLADYLAAAVAASLPWSSSATSILVVLWLIALIPALDWPALRRELCSAAGGLPVALFALGALGMLWADIIWIERMRGLDSYVKLLVIPLLFVHFRQSKNGLWPLTAFLVSAAVLLAVSFASVVTPDNLWGLSKHYGIPVKDYISQAGEFTLAAFGAFFIALRAFRDGENKLAGAWTLLGAAFLANIVLVVTSRTALVTIPVLALLFALTQFAGKARIAAVALLVAAAIAALALAPVASERLASLNTEIAQYQETSRATSAGERLEFWTKAVKMVRDAPVFGHGTGSIREMYRRAAEGQTGLAAAVAANPHNQTLAVAIQLGALGVAVLFAMWIVHAMLFWGSALPAFVGMMVVVQNVVGSLFNSHLFDFTQGWIYVFGVGIAGGMMLAARDKAARPPLRKKRRRR
jgi:O-antigen ligase